LKSKTFQSQTDTSYASASCIRVDALCVCKAHSAILTTIVNTRADVDVQWQTQQTRTFLHSSTTHTQ